MDYKLMTLKQNPSLTEKQWQVTQQIWERFLLNSKVANNNWNKLEKYFPEYQMFLLDNDNEIIGFANTIPIRLDKKLSRLPQTGWDWLMQKGVGDHEKDLIPNYLGGLQIGISKKYQNKGYSTIIIKEVKKKFVENKLNGLIIPIRPTLKHLYPLISMKDYMYWKENDKIFDPWIRIHLNCGAKIIKICKKSMLYTATIREWEEWTGLSFKTTGNYIIKGALSKLFIDIRKNIGKYYDENIWVHYNTD
ncbi:MAG: hypothetical protein A2086_13255 [Spirochaetes bacterium GWD1_27_9]|nr:MAG: hypothetical protein A2Z98_11270 [Spirochaetes bacterium GWB1_27_13]OHD23371.1 MAG: hypothetical protein A2Y34_05180 [Spirochaetes bacterium GWC1_27_15]OHD34809.1 MAG: hypothetical protein A2086_13255 [Spirochaetes bacterium GWD1_27_9]